MAAGDLVYEKSVKGVLDNAQRQKLIDFLAENGLWPGTVSQIRHIELQRLPDNSVAFNIFGEQTVSPGNVS